VVLTIPVVAARPWTAERLRLRGGNPTALATITVTIGLLAASSAVDALVTISGLHGHGSLGLFLKVLRDARGTGLAAAILILGGLAGVAEELFFRGYLQARLAQRWRPWTAIVVTSVCFAVMHFDWVHTPFAFLIGLWLGFAAERTGSLIPVMVAHVVNNSLSTVFAAAGISTERTWPNVIVAAISIAVFAVCARQLARAHPRPHGAMRADIAA
jgi:membrane protease YdiL (CAAX protease family)